MAPDGRHFCFKWLRDVTSWANIKHMPPSVTRAVMKGADAISCLGSSTLCMVFCLMTSPSPQPVCVAWWCVAKTWPSPYMNNPCPDKMSYYCLDARRATCVGDEDCCYEHYITFMPYLPPIYQRLYCSACIGMSAWMLPPHTHPCMVSIWWLICLTYVILQLNKHWDVDMEWD